VFLVAVPFGVSVGILGALLVSVIVWVALLTSYAYKGIWLVAPMVLILIFDHAWSLWLPLRHTTWQPHRQTDETNGRIDA